MSPLRERGEEWRPFSYPEDRLAAVLALTADPGRSWPVDWEVAGAAYGFARWSATVRVDLFRARLSGGRGPHDVLLLTQMGVFRGTAILVETHWTLGMTEPATLVDGHGPLVFVCPVPDPDPAWPPTEARARALAAAAAMVAS